MPYSLVSAATLGFDLVRLPAGPLGRRRSCWPASVPTPSRSPPSPPSIPAAACAASERGVLAVRVPQGPRAGRRRPARCARAAQGPRPATGPPSSSPSSSAARSATPRPSSGSLRDDVLGPEHLARGFLHRRRVGRGRRRARRRRAGLLGRRRAAAARPPRADRPLRPRPRPRRAAAAAAPTSAGCRRLAELLDAVRGLDAAGRAALAAPPSTRARPSTGPGPPRCTRPPGPVTSPGRTRALAAAQLHAVQAFLDGGFDLHDGAAGVLERPRPAACRARRWPTCSTRARSPSCRAAGSRVTG